MSYFLFNKCETRNKNRYQNSKTSWELKTRNKKHELYQTYTHLGGENSEGIEGLHGFGILGNERVKKTNH